MILSSIRRFDDFFLLGHSKRLQKIQRLQLSLLPFINSAPFPTRHSLDIDIYRTFHKAHILCSMLPKSRVFESFHVWQDHRKVSTTSFLSKNHNSASCNHHTVICFPTQTPTELPIHPPQRKTTTESHHDTITTVANPPPNLPPAFGTHRFRHELELDSRNITPQPRSWTSPSFRPCRSSLLPTPHPLPRNPRRIAPQRAAAPCRRS